MLHHVSITTMETLESSGMDAMAYSALHENWQALRTTRELNTSIDSGCAFPGVGNPQLDRRRGRPLGSVNSFKQSET